MRRRLFVLCAVTLASCGDDSVMPNPHTTDAPIDAPMRDAPQVGDAPLPDGGGADAQALFLVHVGRVLATLDVTTDLPQTSIDPFVYVRTTCDVAASERACT